MVYGHQSITLLYLILYNALNHLECFAFVCYGNEVRKVVKPPNGQHAFHFQQNLNQNLNPHVCSSSMNWETHPRLAKTKITPTPPPLPPPIYNHLRFSSLWILKTQLGYPAATHLLHSHQVCQEDYCSVQDRVGFLLFKKNQPPQQARCLAWMQCCFGLHSSYLPPLAILCVQQDPSYCCNQLCCEMLYVCKTWECLLYYKPLFHTQQRCTYVTSAVFEVFSI